MKQAHWRNILVLPATLLVVVCFIAPLQAQTLYGSLLGNITDPSGAAVPGAKVQVQNAATGLSRETETNERGAYLFPDLPAGTYEIRVTATAFGTLVQTGVNISTNLVVRADLQLKLASTNEAITVAASAPSITRRSPSRSQGAIACASRKAACAVAG